MTASDRIAQLVDEGKRELAPYLREWVEAHLVSPRLVELCTDLETQETAHLWLVTDHNGHNDSGYRVVFDPKMNMFGHETQIKDGPSYLLGFYGSFADTIEGM